MEIELKTSEILSTDYKKTITVVQDGPIRRGVFNSFAIDKSIVLNQTQAKEYLNWIFTENTNKQYFVFNYQLQGKIEQHSFGKPIMQTGGMLAMYYLYDFARLQMLENTDNSFLIFVIDVEYLLNRLEGLSPKNKGLIKDFGKINNQNKLFQISGFNYSVHNILNQIIDCTFSDDIKAIYYEAKFWELFSHFIAEYNDRGHGLNSDSIKADLNHKDKDRIHQAREYLKKCYDSPPTIIELSRKIGLNEYKLKKGFKEVFNSTVYSYIIELRLQKARELLASREMSIIEISNAVGYSNPSHFAKIFKKRFGILPKDFIKVIPS